MAAPARQAGGYGGRGPVVFWQEIIGVLLSVLTLGIYRFWLRTTQRRYYWSNLVVLRYPLEYSGRGVELFIGALIAFVILAFYLVVVFLIVNLWALTSVDIAAQQAMILAMQVALAPLLPLVPYARYRAQRYFVGRIRWRGVRFAIENAAWRYTGRAILWAIAIALTLGVLKPLADYRQRAFITRRMSYGDTPFRLGGSPTGLYRSFTPVLIGVVGFLATLAHAFVNRPLYGPSNNALASLTPVFVIVAVVGYFWYISCRRAYFIRHTTLGDTGLSNAIRGASVFWLRFRTWLATILISSAFSGVVYAVLTAVAAVIGVSVDSPSQGLQLDFSLATGFFIVFYVASIAAAIGAAGACHQAIFVTGMMRRAAEGMRVRDPNSIDRTRQLPDERDRDADGFADAIGSSPF